MERVDPIAWHLIALAVSAFALGFAVARAL